MRIANFPPIDDAPVPDLPNLKIQLQVDPGLKQNLLTDPANQFQTLIACRPLMGDQVVGLDRIEGEVAFPNPRKSNILDQFSRRQAIRINEWHCDTVHFAGKSGIAGNPQFLQPLGQGHRIPRFKLEINLDDRHPSQGRLSVRESDFLLFDLP